jgi:hypothetical protein
MARPMGAAPTLCLHRQCSIDAVRTRSQNGQSGGVRILVKGCPYLGPKPSACLPRLHSVLRGMELHQP